MESDWGSTLVVSGNGQLAQDDNGFWNADTSGAPLGGPRPVYLNNDYSIEGLAYFSGGFAVVQDTVVGIHNPFTFQQHIAPLGVPEQSTAALLLATTPLLLLRRSRRIATA